MRNGLHMTLWSVYALVMFVSSSMCAAQGRVLGNDADFAELEQLLEENVVMIATRTQERITEAPAIVTVITAHQIRVMGARTVTDVLETIPGVETLIQEYGYEEVVIRGGRQESQRVKFLVNGHSMNPPRTGQPAVFLDDLTIENVQRIEVIRGPGSALYGTNAFNGVVNIITKDAEAIDGVTLIAKGGNQDTKVAGLLFGTTLHDVMISGYAEYSDTDGADQVLEQDAQTILDQQYASFGIPAVSLAPGGVNMSRTKTDLNLDIHYHNATLRSKYLHKVNGPYIGVNHTLNTGSEWILDYAFLEGQYVHALHDRVESLWTVSWDRVTEEYRFQGSPEGFTIPSDLDGDGDIEIFPDGRTGRLKTRFDIFNGEWQGTYRPEGTHTLIGGVAVQEIRQSDNYTDSNFSRSTDAALEPGELDTRPSFEDNRRTVWALFLQDQWKVTETLGLTLGIRHDQYSDFGGTTNPRVALVWGIRSDLFLKILYGRAFLAPSFQELYLMNNPVVVGNPNLRATTIHTFEVGATYQLAEQVRADVTYFYNKDDDIIVYTPQTDPTTPAQFVNGAGDLVQGIEIALNATFNERFSGYVNYTFRETEVQDADADVPFAAKHLARAGITLPLTDIFTLNVQASFVGERPREAIDEREPVEQYMLVDGTLHADDIYPGLDLFCSIHNLLDTAYEKPSVAGTLPGDYPMPRRSVLVGLRYDLFARSRSER